MVVLCIQGETIGASFTDSEEGKSCFRAATFNEMLAFSPGNAMANNHGGPAFPVAAVDEKGNLVLDYGTVVAGCQRNFPDTFRVTNLTQKGMEVSFSWVSFSGSAEIPVFQDIVGTFYLEAGETRRIDTGLGSAAVCGEVYGALGVYAGGYSCLVPVKVTIIDPPAGRGKEGGTDSGDVPGLPDSNAGGSGSHPGGGVVPGAPGGGEVSIPEVPGMSVDEPAAGRPGAPGGGLPGGGEVSIPEVPGMSVDEPAAGHPGAGEQ